MRGRRRWLAVAVSAFSLLVAGCGGDTTDESASEPATLTEIAGTDLSRIVLTERAAERLRIATAPARPSRKHVVVPYSAVRYEPTGEAWVYVSPARLTFVRRPVVVQRIDGQRAFLSKGVTPGTRVATVGVSELFGFETGLG